MENELRKTILLVEDEFIIAIDERMTLERYGYEVIIANTGEAALNIVENNPNINLILMDINLGNEIDGTEVASKILEKHYIPIVFLSSHTEREVVERTEGITSYGYIVKNSGETVLIASIKMAFRLFETRLREKEKEEALYESEAMFKSYFNMSTVGMCVTSTEKKIIEANDCFCNMLGYSREELLSFTWAELSYPDDLNADIILFNQVLAGERDNYELEKRFIRKDGQIIYTLLYATCKRDSNGTVKYFLASFINITDNKKIHNELIKTNKLLEQTFEQSPVPMVLVSMPEAIIKIVNTACRKFLGIDDEPSYIGTSLFDFVPSFKDIDAEGNMSLIKDLPLAWSLKGEKTYNEERKIIRKDGTVRWELVSGVPIFDDNGEIIAGYLIMVDITERKKAEDSLKIQSLVLDQIKDFVTVTDMNGIIIYVNQAVVNTLKKTKEEIIGNKTETYGEDISRGASQKEILEKTLQDGSWRGEVVNFAKDGSEHILDCQTQIVYDTNGNPIGLCGVSTDITERKQMEEKLKNQNDFIMVLFESFPMGIAVWDADDNLLQINQTFTKLLGYTIDDVSDREKWSSNAYPDPIYRESVINEWDNAHRTSNLPIIKEFKVTCKDKTVKDIEFRTIFLSDGRAILTLVDITERKKIDEELYKFKALSDNAKFGIAITDLEGNILYINETLARMHEYSVDELIGKHVFIFHNEEQMPSVNETLEILNKNDSFSAKEIWHTTKSGKIFPTLMHVALVRDKQGTPLFFSVTAIDITEYKKIEAYGNENIRRFRDLFEHNRDGIIVLDGEGKILDANKAFCDMLGYSIEELKSMDNLAKTTPEKWYEWESKEIWNKRLLQDGYTGLYEKECIRKDGSIFPVELQGFTVIKNDKIVYIWGVVRDITERKKIEKELKESQERYSNFISQIFEGIYRTEFDNPIDITLPIEEQIDKIYENAYMAECNDALAQMYNLPSADSFIGVRLIDAHKGKDNPINRETFRRLIKNGYKSINDETLEYTTDGKPIYFLSNTIGIVENGFLIRLWGTAIPITKQKQIEEKLRTQNEFIMSLFESLPIIVMVWDANNNLLQINQFFTMLTGYTADDIPNREKWIEKAYPDPVYREKVLADWKEARKSTNAVREFKITCKDKTIKDIEFRGAFLTDGRAIITLVDITERRKAEEELLKFKTISDKATFGVIISEIDGNILYVNETFARMHEYSIDELIGKNRSILHSKEQRPLINKILETSSKQNNSSEQKVWHITKSGTPFLTLVSPLVVNDKQGSPQYIYATAIDITEQEKYKEQLEQFFNVNLDLLCISDMEGNFIKVNPEWETILGYSVSELEKMKSLDFIHPEDIPSTLESISSLSKQKKVINFTNRYRCKDGSYRYIEWRSYPVGNLIYSAARDITAHILAEETIKNQLKEKEILLKEVHHRIKNNIASIGGMLRLQANSITNSESQNILQDAISRVESMRIIYDKLLLGEDYKDISVKYYLEDLIDAIISIFPENNKITVKKEINDFNLNVKLLFLLGTITNEIITNSMKYAFIDKNKGLVEISLTKNENHINLIIKDNGKGLPKNFDINKTQSLGLMIIKMISQQLNGNFTMESHNGTRFSLKFDIP